MSVAQLLVLPKTHQNYKKKFPGTSAARGVRATRLSVPPHVFWPTPAIFDAARPQSQTQSIRRSRRFPAIDRWSPSRVVNGARPSCCCCGGGARPHGTLMSTGCRYWAALWILHSLQSLRCTRPLPSRPVQSSRRRRLIRCRKSASSLIFAPSCPRCCGSKCASRLSCAVTSAVGATGSRVLSPTLACEVYAIGPVRSSVCFR